MSIKKLGCNNILRIRNKLRLDKVRDGAFEIQFEDGINIFLGENGIGKTSILKMIYAATKWSFEKNLQGKTVRFINFFSYGLDDSDLIGNVEKENDSSYFYVSDGENEFRYNILKDTLIEESGWVGLNISSVYIPASEMLSHSKGFLALNAKYKLPFDEAQIDIIVNASLPETREIQPQMKMILSLISRSMGGDVIQENDDFYVLKNNGKKIPFTMEAEGFRKLGLLWKLIRNGLFENGSVLLWDEPESNLNPELFPLIAEVLLRLEENGVQIFIATHSYNIAKYFELRRKRKKQVVYHSLHRPNGIYHTEFSDRDHPFSNCMDGICLDKSYYLREIGNNSMMNADEALLDEAFDKDLAD